MIGGPSKAGCFSASGLCGAAGLRFGIIHEMCGISDTVHSEEKTVEVHGMTNGCRIDDPPMNRFTGCVSETFGFGPRLPVDGEYEAGIAFVPVVDNENAIALFRSGWVNNE